METTVSISPLLRLPAELRLQIYTHLLTAPDLSTTRRLTTRGHLSAYLIPSPNLCPSILLANRQIHAEASPVLYTGNTFCAHPTLLTSLPFLLHTDRPVLYPHISSTITRYYLSVRLDTDARFTADQVTDAFSGKQYVEVECWQAMFASVDLHVLRLFEGIRGVREARVCGSVGTGYKKWLEGSMTSRIGEEVARWEGEGGKRGNYDIWDNGNR